MLWLFTSLSTLMQMKPMVEQKVMCHMVSAMGKGKPEYASSLLERGGREREGGRAGGKNVGQAQHVADAEVRAPLGWGPPCAMHAGKVPQLPDKKAALPCSRKHPGKVSYAVAQCVARLAHHLLNKMTAAGWEEAGTKVSTNHVSWRFTAMSSAFRHCRT
jgi:hypothetical protein